MFEEIPKGLPQLDKDYWLLSKQPDSNTPADLNTQKSLEDISIFNGKEK